MASPTPIELGARIKRLADDVATADAEVAAIEGRLAAAKASAAGLRRAKKETELELERATDLATDRLIEAARLNDLAAARAALEAGADPHRPTREGWNAEGFDEAVDEAMLSPLMWAANRSSRGMALLLLDEGGADPNQATTEAGITALMIIAYHGDLEIAQLLLERSADPNPVSTNNGSAALMIAAHQGHLEFARVLLEHSADPNQARTDDWSTALTQAAQCGHLEVTQLLLLFRADPDVMERNGATAEALAVSNGHPVVAACLGAIAGWPAFKTAAACRLHADARRMLHCGTVDPSDCSLDELTTVSCAPPNALWPGSPGPCDATMALVRAAMASWSPGRHSLYHPGVRSGVLTTLLVAHRLHSRHAVGSTLTPHQLQVLPLSSAPMIGLPNELWLAVCSFLRRSDWAV